MAAQGHKQDLVQMYQEWPFFQSTIDLIEMVRYSSCALRASTRRVWKISHDWLIACLIPLLGLD